MRKIINEGSQIVSEMMEGFCGAYHKYYTKHPEVNGVIGKQRRRNKVSLVIKFFIFFIFFCGVSPPHVLYCTLLNYAFRPKGPPFGQRRF